jgi:putative hemolysin
MKLRLFRESEHLTNTHRLKVKRKKNISFDPGKEALETFPCDGREKENQMARKLILSLFLLTGMLLLAFCTSQKASPIPELNKISLTDRATTPKTNPLVNMANPASVSCEKNGGKLELRQDAAGAVAGICVFPDGSECDEWAYYRNECKPGDSLATGEPAAASATRLRVVYFKDKQIMSWTEGNGTQSLVKASTEQMHISDDGQVVAYLGYNSDGIYGLYGVNADGTNERQLVGQETLEKTQPASQIVSFDFAPGSHRLYFVTDQYDLQTVDADGANPTVVFGAGKGGFFSFSPDGQWMTLYHPNELVLAHPDGSAARLAFTYPQDFSYTMMGPEVAWKADSSGFSLVSASGPQGEADSMTVWFIPVNGEPVKQMSYAGPYGANLSPDGSSVVYLYSQHEPVDVHIVSRDGQDTSCGSYSSYQYPRLIFMGWAPDSKSFLLNLSNDGRMLDPYLCKAGESPVKLTDTPDAYPVVWVDAQRILFVSGSSLRLQHPGQKSLVLDSVSSSYFDFTTFQP